MATAAKIAVGVVGVIGMYFGVTELWGAGAALSTLGEVSAGAQIAGGAMAVYGDATNNKSLMTAGALIGTAGALGASGDLGFDPNAPTTGPDVAAPTPVAPSTPVPPSETTGGMLTGTTPNPLYTPSQSVMPVGNLTEGVNVPMTTAQEIQAGNAQLMKYSLVAGGINGASNAIASRTQSDIAAQTAANQLTLQQQEWQRANSVGQVNMSGNPVQPGMLQSDIAIPPNLIAPTIAQQNPAGLAAPPPVKQPTTIQFA